ncbi:hypothetical protein BDV18DRAFT_158223 [Aspergillus unguis]
MSTTTEYTPFDSQLDDWFTPTVKDDIPQTDARAAEVLSPRLSIDGVDLNDLLKPMTKGPSALSSPPVSRGGSSSARRSQVSLEETLPVAGSSNVSVSRGPSPGTMIDDEEMHDTPSSPIRPPKSAFSDESDEDFDEDDDNYTNMANLKGEGPFWRNDKRSENYTQSPVDLIFTNSLKDQLLKAKAQIWELELQRSRDAWKLEYEEEKNHELSDRLNYLRRKNRELIQERNATERINDVLRDGKIEAEKNVIDTAWRIRELEGLRANESILLVRAQMKIEDLQEELDACETCSKKRKRAPESQVVDYQERASKRYSWD